MEKGCGEGEVWGGGTVGALLPSAQGRVARNAARQVKSPPQEGSQRVGAAGSAARRWPWAARARLRSALEQRSKRPPRQRRRREEGVSRGQAAGKVSSDVPGCQGKAARL
jgi:hypothetical protein